MNTLPHDQRCARTDGSGPVLVLGASGRLGRMMRLLRPKTTTPWHFQSRRAAPWANIIWDGTRSDPSLEQYLIQNRPRAILNLIGRTTAPSAQAFEAVNVDIPQHLLDLAQKHQLRHVALVSSAAVYGLQPDWAATVETAALNPMNAYGRSKARMEAMAHKYKEGISVSILRIGNVAGADRVLSLAERGTLALDQLSDDTTPLRSYIGPRDLAETLSILMQAPPYPGINILNVAHPQPVRLDDLLRAYRARINAGLVWAKRRAPASVISKVVLDTAALEELKPSQHYTVPALALANQVTELRRQIACQ